MAVQRAVVYGTIGGLVQVRNMFTCDVVESGGDDAALLWGAYLTSIYDPIEDLLSIVYSTYQYELQARTAGHWVSFDVEDFAHTGVNTGEPLPNAVSIVLIGVAAGLRHLGRKFLGPIAEGSSDGNYVHGSEMTTALSVLVAYITAFTGIGGGTITPGVIDKTETFHPFVGGNVSSLLGSMRRRKPGVGI